MTAADMEKCRWLKPQLLEHIEFAEWTLRIISGTPGLLACAKTKTLAR